MSGQFGKVKDGFNKKWIEFKTGYDDLERKMNDPSHVVHDEFVISQVHRAVLSNQYVFNKYGNKSSKIIDMACGNGFNTCYLLTKGYDVKGFDISDNAIADANSLLKRLGISKDAFSVADQTYLRSVADNSVDVVMALGLMRYLEADIRDYIYKEVFRVLKKNGCFIVSNDNYLFELFALNEGTINFWASTVEGFSDAKDLLPEKSVSKALVEKIKLPQRQYSEHSVSKNIKRHSENPLTYGEVVGEYGFRLGKNVYPDCHLLPPLFERNVDKEALEAMKAEICLKKAETWQAMFMGFEFLSFLVKE